MKRPASRSRGRPARPRESALLRGDQEVAAAVLRVAALRALVAERLLLALADDRRRGRRRRRGWSGRSAPRWRGARRAPGCIPPCRARRSGPRPRCASEVHRFRYSEFFCSDARASSARSELSSRKNTSPSGFLAFSSSSDMRAKISSSVGTRVSGAGVGAGGGGGGGGGVASTGGGGGGIGGRRGRLLAARRQGHGQAQGNRQQPRARLRHRGNSREKGRSARPSAAPTDHGNYTRSRPIRSGSAR